MIKSALTLTELYGHLVPVSDSPWVKEFDC